MKRLILLFDGTWNSDEGDAATNIVRLRETLDKSLGEGQAPTDRQTSGTIVDGVEHVVFYDSGPGTGLTLDRILGGAAGSGITTNIRQGYRFLSRYYAPGDEIFVFGFSRGAYSARSLVGYVASAGLLRSAACTWERENEAWSLYRTRPKDRPPGARAALVPYVHPSTVLEIKCLGVFDTVGSLGVPLDRLRRFNNARHEFHDVVLGSITEINLHAVAIDERRRHFEAALWTKPKFQQYGTRRRVEQVWFPGVHADIGGGYLAPGAEPQQQSRAALEFIALDWMIKRVRTLAQLDLRAWRPSVGPDWAHAPQHNSLGSVYRLWKEQVRTIAATNPTLARRQAVTGKLPYDVTVGEMVHISALERLGRDVPCGRKHLNYRPSNLMAALPLIERTYGEDASEIGLKVVDWSGEPIDPQLSSGRQQVQGLIAAAKSRIGDRG